MNRPFKTYNGGKNGSGVYQAIINQVPPHEVFISGFAGNCGVLANKKPAPFANIAIDMDIDVVKAWGRFGHVDAIAGDALVHLPQLIERFKRMVASYKIFILIDPPYLEDVRSSKQDYYKHEMKSAAAHKNLLSAARHYDCNVLITHYPCDLYNEMLHGWRHMDIQGRTRNGMRTERLYMNYPEPTELHDYNFFGNDYREREAYKLMQKNMVQKFKRMTELERNFIIHSINHGQHR